MTIGRRHVRSSSRGERAGSFSAQSSLSPPPPDVEDEAVPLRRPGWRVSGEAPPGGTRGHPGGWAAPCPAHAPRGTGLPGPGPCQPRPRALAQHATCLSLIHPFRPVVREDGPTTVPSGILQPPQTAPSGFLKADPPSGPLPPSADSGL